MKVKKQRSINTVLLIIILTMVSLWIAYNYIKSLEILLTLTDWMMIFAALGAIFIVIDTVEIMLLRAGQRKWTHHPGETMVEMIDDMYDALKKNPASADKLMIISANIFEAGMNGVEGVNDESGRTTGAGPKITLPEKWKRYEGMVNQPQIRGKFWKKINGVFDGKKGKGDKLKKAEEAIDMGLGK